MKRLTIALILFLSVAAQAGTFLFPSNSVPRVTLAWDPSPDTNVVSYNVYWGVVSRGYTNLVNVVGTNAVTISGLARGATYYFAATALNDVGLESPFSNEASYSVPTMPQAPLLHPVIRLAVEVTPRLDNPDWVVDPDLPLIALTPDANQNFYRLKVTQ